MRVLNPEMNKVVLITGMNAYPGVERIATVLQKDFLSVFDCMPEKMHINELRNRKAHAIDEASFSVVILTAERDAEYEEFAAEIPALNDIKGQREVFFFGEAENAKYGKVLLIAGSDKRGTIYGMFRLSEMIGVNAMTWIGDAAPKKQKEIALDLSLYISKEPSVKYRGFFINDEWPAFGGWCRDNYGDINASAYENIFITLLRMKGNYMWPAMWSGRFWNDGPDLASALLADELGVVMGTSHHEPCIRAGEEYRHVRGKDSIYGDAWSYLTNPEGITKFWEDGLKRAGHLENIITTGMRGEADSMILGADATLKDNIDLLRGVIVCQNKLMREIVNEDLTKVPRMLALYKEVERYFYGDKETEGLIDWPELDGITCMLCEDNQGNMRTLPDEKHRNRKGGWGMYYHFDYHGGPVSFEWLCTTLLPKVKEQMGMAYEHGVKEIWIVNVGDLKFNEMPLNYFLDLAYDFDTVNELSYKEYLKTWCARYFAESDSVAAMIDEYMHIMHLRRTETILPETYEPKRDGVLMLARVNAFLADLETLYNAQSGDAKEAFYSMLYFQFGAAVNVLKMQLLAGLNHYAAGVGSVAADVFAEEVKKCIAFDKSRSKTWDEFKNKKWYHMAESMHVGFRSWNEEISGYPDLRYVEGFMKDRIFASVIGEDRVSAGGDWTGSVLTMTELLTSGKDSSVLRLLNGADHDVSFTMEYDDSAVSIEEIDEFGGLFKETEGTIHALKSYRVTRLDGAKDSQILVRYNGGKIRVNVPSRKDSIFVIPADEMKAEGSFVLYEGLGRECDAYKASPSTATFEDFSLAPKLHFTVKAPTEGMYSLRLVTAPSNPVQNGGGLRVYVQDSESVQIVNTIHDGYMGGENSSIEWCDGVLDQKHVTLVDIVLGKGENEITIGALDAAVVVEGAVVMPKSMNYPYRYIEFTK